MSGHPRHVGKVAHNNKAQQVVSATATAEGLVELATTAETTTGTDTTRGVTPGGLHAGLKALTDTAVATGDQFYYADADDSNNMKSDTVQGILDLVSTGLTLGTEQASTSGTAITFTGIPAGTKLIIVNFEGVSQDASDNFAVTIGDSGGLETSGYVSTTIEINSTTISNSSSTTSFQIQQNNAAEIMDGQMFLTLKDAANFTWVASYSIKSGTAIMSFGAGVKSLSAELTQLSISLTGVGSFDAGSINIMYM